MQTRRLLMCWQPQSSSQDMNYIPSRVIFQDFSVLKPLPLRANLIRSPSGRNNHHGSGRNGGVPVLCLLQVRVQSLHEFTNLNCWAIKGNDFPYQEMIRRARSRREVVISFTLKVESEPSPVTSGEPLAAAAAEGMPILTGRACRFVHGQHGSIT